MTVDHLRALHDATKRIGLLEAPSAVLDTAARVVAETFGGVDASAFQQRPGPSLEAVPHTTGSRVALPSRVIDVHCVVSLGRALRAQDVFVEGPPGLNGWSFAPLEADGRVHGVLGVAREVVGPQLEILCAVATVAAVTLSRIEAHDAALEAERKRARLSRYLSPRVVDHLGALGTSDRCPGVRCDATVLLSDIRGFTSLSEGLDPSAILELLNQYFDAMIEIIDDEGGVVDKLMGDGLLAVFGAPDPVRGHARMAARAAARMVQAASAPGPGRRALRIGVGLASGSVIVGDVGGKTFLDFTVLGSPVNIAARLEAMTKSVRVPILATAETVRQLGSRLDVGSARDVNLAGISHPVRVHPLDPAVVLSQLTPLV